MRIFKKLCEQVLNLCKFPCGSHTCGTLKNTTRGSINVTIFKLVKRHLLKNNYNENSSSSNSKAGPQECTQTGRVT